MIKRNDYILKFIDEYTKRNRISPSMREIGKAVGLSSVSSVHGHVHRLQKKGYIEIIRDKPRTMTVTKNGKERAGRIRGELYDRLQRSLLD